MMRSLWNSAKTFVRDESAPTFVEYGLLLSLIVITVMAAVTEFGSGVEGIWSVITEYVQQL